MRTKAGDKEKLKERVLKESLPMMKRSGLSRMPVDQMMGQLGLTSGALYSHFGSKEEFAVEMILAGLDRLRERHEQNRVEHGAGALAFFILKYLDDRHVKSFEKGCTFVALGSDIHRFSAEDRARIEEKIDLVIEGLRPSLPGESLSDARFLFSSLVGALTFARMQHDAEKARAYLQAAKDHLFKLFGIDPDTAMTLKEN